MFLEERQRRIYELLKQRQRLEVNELIEIFDVSGDTVRRDLTEMQNKGILRRTHGGAVLSEKNSTILDYRDRDETAKKVKEDIARLALDFIEEHDTLFLNSSTTVAYLAGMLGEFRQLTVFTNSIDAASRIVHVSDSMALQLIGGSVNISSRSTVNAKAVHELDSIRVDKVFIGACSISAEWGLSTPDIEEVDFNRKLLEIGREIYVLADKSKFHVESTFKIAELGSNMRIITDLPEVELKDSPFKRHLDKGLRIYSCAD